MKVLLFSLLSAIAGIAIYAENPVGYSYTPLVREGVEWGYKWTYSPLKEGSYYLQLSGDTLINSKTYSATDMPLSTSRKRTLWFMVSSEKRANGYMR